ncbi:MAG: MATE family efflux transporter [Pseudomonadota bacterium]
MSEPSRPITYARVTAIAVPVVLSNATVPLQGAIDMAIIGNTGDTTLLAAVTLGATMIALVFSSFNFLQIGVSGLTAQALGAGKPTRVMNTLLRALMIAALISLVLILVRAPLGRGILLAFEASDAAEAAALSYFVIRVLGAPFELGVYPFFGWFAGQERTRRLFEMQLIISVANIGLTFLFVLVFEWGIEGVAFGTVCGNAAGLAYALWYARRRRREILPPTWRPERRRLFDGAELATLMRLNRDIFIRTVLLVVSMTWVARLGSLQSDAVLAANGILLEFLFITSHGLDGFAIAAETLVGQAKGARSKRALRRAAVISSVAAFGVAALFSVILWVFAHDIIRIFTDLEPVREVAFEYAIWAALIPLVGVGAYQLDGIFVGASDGPAMRNSMIVAAGVFLPVGWWATVTFGNHAMWASLWLFLIVRALALLALYPRLEARVS